MLDVFLVKVASASPLADHTSAMLRHNGTPELDGQAASESEGLIPPPNNDTAG